MGIRVRNERQDRYEDIRVANEYFTIQGNISRGNGVAVEGINNMPPDIPPGVAAGEGIRGLSAQGDGVAGVTGATGRSGVYGQNHAAGGNGVAGRSNNGNGVYGIGVNGNGVYGGSDNGNGVYGRTRTGFAGFFEGRVRVTGVLEKPGGGFKIDHPLAPASKYLNHSFVESSEMKNVYDGVAVLDGDGAASVELPEWFGDLNRDLRYQLTAIGAPAPDLHIAEELSDARFKISGGKPGMKVSWQVTGIRQDAWANSNPLQVEEDKRYEEQGHYLHPELFDEAGKELVAR